MMNAPRETTVLAPELLTEILQPEALKLLRDNSYYLQRKENGQRRRTVKRREEVFGLNRQCQRVALPARLQNELVNLPLQTLDLDGEIIGETLIAFDALDIDGDLTATAYSNRLARLLDLLQAWDNGIFGEPMPPRVSVLPCPTWFTTEEKTAGYAQEFDRRGEGVVFRKADAPYRPGRCRQNYKLKFTKTLTALVTAIHIDKKGRPDPSKQNAALALLDPATNQWISVGEVTTIGKANACGVPEIIPGLLVEVRMLYATAEKQLYQPRIVAVRTDLAPADAVISQLIYREGVEL